MGPRWLRLMLSVFLLAISSRAFRQDTASITGTVTDLSGASIADARIAVDNHERSIHRTTVTNASGEFLVPGLSPSSYDLSITASGFKKYQANEIVLRVAQNARVNVTLQVGSASTQVTVSGQDVAQVETQSSELAGTITGKQITQLELTGRNFTQLVTLVPGVSGGQDEGFVGIQFLDCDRVETHILAKFGREPSQPSPPMIAAYALTAPHHKSSSLEFSKSSVTFLNC